MSRNVIVTLLLVLAAAAGAGSSGVFTSDGDGDAGGGGPAGEGRVVRVVDGDTIAVLVGGRRERVRYIGIDTPETHHPTKPVQCYGAKAAAYNARLVAGERVRLVRDVEERDRFGRLLAYVYRVRDGLFVNAELARRGYARALTIAPDVRYAERFATLVHDARAAGRGLWSAC
ncbi:MAG TPA: thermonuclease family protein [Solirubrobacteraceae bacterium]|nr:thermonuclease family protein [Solirubrobacteraceae bacterium]